MLISQQIGSTLFDLFMITEVSLWGQDITFESLSKSIYVDTTLKMLATEVTQVIRINNQFP